jgi:allantoate deiminase
MVTFTGHANHAGTTPMHLRRDALAAAAEWISFVESYAKRADGLVATVGSVGLSPGVGNVVPGVAELSLDVRHAFDEVRKVAVNAFQTRARMIGAERGIACRFEERLDQPAVQMDAALGGKLEEAMREAGCPIHHMTSGAGHDAMILAPLVPATMLFVRSPGGVSHHPDETVLRDDVALALECALRFIRHV